MSERKLIHKETMVLYQVRNITVLLTLLLSLPKPNSGS